jgi:hypothetical protein
LTPLPGIEARFLSADDFGAAHDVEVFPVLKENAGGLLQGRPV